MSGLADYLEQLRMRQESLQNTISELGQTLIRLELIRRLEAIAQRIREWEAGFVIDRGRSTASAQCLCLGCNRPWWHT